MATIFQPAGSRPTFSFTPKSKFISLCDYDPAADSMTITFKSGSTYRYIAVGSADWERFEQAKDHDSFYTNAIKGKFNSIPLVRQPIGKPRPKSLKQQRSPNNVGVFNAGIRSAQRQRQAGNIPASLSR